MAKKTITGASVAELQEALLGLMKSDEIVFEIVVTTPDWGSEFDILSDRLRPVAEAAYKVLKVLNANLAEGYSDADVRRFIATYVKRNVSNAKRSYTRKNGIGKFICKMAAAMYNRQYFAADMSVDTLAHKLTPAVGSDNYQTQRRNIYGALKDIREGV